MPMRSSEVVVLGGGTNGLACAFRLAREGARVTVLEAAPEVGGGAQTTEFAPGFRVSALAHLVHLLDPRVERDMALDRHGLRLSAPLPTTALGPDPLTLAPDGRAEALPPAEAAAWDLLRTRLHRFARALEPLRRTAPPHLGRGNDWGTLARTGLDLRRRGAAEFREFGRMLLLNAADALEDELSDPRLMGLCAFDATLGASTGPRSPGTLLLWLNRLSGAPPRLPMGGMGAVASAMRAACEAAGVRIRTGARVTRLHVERDRATGVTLTSGERIAAQAVVSALCPRTTLLDILPPGELDTDTERAARSIRARGAAAKLHLALSALPDFGADPRARLVVAPSVDAVEEAWNPAKYGEVPDRPVMEVLLPSALDPSAAPPGQHVLSAIVQFAPWAPPDPDAARARLLDNALRVLESHAPGLRSLVLHAELLLPSDIEARFGMAGGSWHHGDLAPERMLFLRPFPEVARYRTPVPGLWLASAGSHPGGGVSGTAGWNAAERIAREGAA